MGRELPLSKLAQQALAGLRAQLPGTPDETLEIFGAHDYRSALKPLAARLGVPVLHLRAMRHNRGTHLADEGKPLTAIAYLFGHKHISTTAIYAKGNRDAAFEAIQGRKKKPA
jgi:integrase